MTERPKLLKVAVSVSALLMSVHLCLASDAHRSLSVVASAIGSDDRPGRRNMEAWHDRFCLICGGPDYFTWDDGIGGGALCCRSDLHNLATLQRRGKVKITDRKISDIDRR
jgi:hypothetical protein